ncbi:MAG TPA: hypothetical protein VKD91_11075 [Pyrinomonadaceae bacterium]|nr:hypothetical protein [Pyrinomonadaceae bacterium]
MAPLSVEQDEGTPERTELGDRCFRVRECGQEFNERIGTSFNRLQYASDMAWCACAPRGEASSATGRDMGQPDFGPAEVGAIAQFSTSMPGPDATGAGRVDLRRVAPDAIKIELGNLTGGRATQAEEEKLFKSMAAELAHLHAGSG